MPSLDSFKTRTSLTVGADTVSIYSLPALEKEFPGVARLPYSLKILLENLLRREDNAFVKTADIRALASWDPKTIGREGNVVHAGAGAAAGLHRRALRRRSGGDARRHRGARRRSAEGQPAAAGRARHRSLGAGRSLRHGERAGAQRRSRIPPQSRALRVPALGTDGVPQLPRRAARDRHRPPGQHRIPRARRVPRRRGRRRDRVSRHRVRHRLAHHDGERAGRGRMGRRRHRSGGGDARPAELDADSAGARLSADRQAAGRRDRHRPRADDHRSASARRASSASSSSSSVRAWRT